jgi:hypothetical protein
VPVGPRQSPKYRRCVLGGIPYDRDHRTPMKASLTPNFCAVASIAATMISLIQAIPAVAPASLHAV